VNGVRVKVLHEYQTASVSWLMVLQTKAMLGYGRPSLSLVNDLKGSEILLPANGSRVCPVGMRSL